MHMQMHIRMPAQAAQVKGKGHCLLPGYGLSRTMHNRPLLPYHRTIAVRNTPLAERRSMEHTKGTPVYKKRLFPRGAGVHVWYKRFPSAVLAASGSRGLGFLQSQSVTACTHTAGTPPAKVAVSLSIRAGRKHRPPRARSSISGNAKCVHLSLPHAIYLPAMPVRNMLPPACQCTTG